MKTLKAGIVVVGALLVGFFGLIMFASESGEVVTLTTTNTDGDSKRTRLWVVDHDGTAWLRAGDPASRWLARIQQSESTVVERDGVSASVNASVDESAAGTVNSLMREKYGWADKLIEVVFGRDDAIAIRLELIQ